MNEAHQRLGSAQLAHHPRCEVLMRTRQTRIAIAAQEVLAYRCSWMQLYMEIWAIGIAAKALHVWYWGA